MPGLKNARNQRVIMNEAGREKAFLVNFPCRPVTWPKNNIFLQMALDVDFGRVDTKSTLFCALFSRHCLLLCYRIKSDTATMM